MKALAHLLPALTESVSPRLRRRLDADPAMAGGWDWSSPGEVITPNGERVALQFHDGVLQSAEDLRCSCLMAPNCLHRLAVLAFLEPVLPESSSSDSRRLELTGEDGGDDDGSLNQGRAGSPPSAETLSSAEIEAAADLWASGARLLEKGAAGGGLLDLAEIQRAAFACKEAGLHRAGAAGTRVARDLRDLRNHSPAFALDVLAEDLYELLLTAHRLRLGEASWRGTARRRYEPVGNLKLFGLYSQPVITTSGYSGCVSVLADAKGQRYQISDVMPGEPSRAQAVYAKAGRTLPGLSVSHRELSGSAVLLQNATASSDGRLGSGRGVRAVLAGESQWEDAFSLEALVLGLQGDALMANGPGGPFRLAAIDHPALPTRHNLEILARWPHRPLRLMGEPHDRLERTFLVHAFECEVGRFNIALDRLHAANFPELRSAPARVSVESPPSPFSSFQQRLLRLVQGGRLSAQPDPVAAAAWTQTGLSCADFWQALVDTASAGSRDLRGIWIPLESDDYALAWLSAMAYLRRARSHWLDSLWSAEHV